MNISIESIEEWDSYSCNSCTKRNSPEHKFYEVRARNLGMILCKGCLLSLKEKIGELE